MCVCVYEKGGTEREKEEGDEDEPGIHTKESRRCESAAREGRSEQESDPTNNTEVLVGISKQVREV